MKKRERKPRGYWTPETVIQEILLRKEQGLGLSVTAIEKDDSNMYKMARKYHGGWKEALVASGLDAEQYARKRPQGFWTPEQVRVEIQKIEATGGDLSVTAVLKDYSSLYVNANTIYGSWQAALEASGINPNEVYRQIPWGHWTQETIVNEIQRRGQEGLGLSTTVVQKEKGTLYSAAVSHFGGWGEALTASGLNIGDHYLKRPNGYWTIETVLEELQAIKDSGLSLERDDVHEYDSTLVNNVNKYLGDWKIALEKLK